MAVITSGSSSSRTASRAITPGSGEGQHIGVKLVELIEHDRLSIASAARALGVDLRLAGILVQLHAIELEAAESEFDERLDAIERLCPNEDWWSYTNRGRTAILDGRAVPNRIVRELVEEWERRSGEGTEQIAQKLGLNGSESLRRSLGMVGVPSRMKNGQTYRKYRQKVIGVECAARIMQAIGVPPCEVPGL